MVRRGRPLEMQAEGLLLLTNDLKLACYRRQMDINRRTFKSLVLFVRAPEILTQLAVTSLLLSPLPSLLFLFFSLFFSSSFPSFSPISDF